MSAIRRPGAPCGRQKPATVDKDVLVSDRGALGGVRHTPKPVYSVQVTEEMKAWIAAHGGASYVRQLLEREMGIGEMPIRSRPRKPYTPFVEALVAEIEARRIDERAARW